MSPAVLDAARLLYSEAVARGELTGAVLLVARHGKVVMHEAIGWSDRENSVPMTTGTVVDIGSMTKPIVATATLVLAERGTLSLDDPVSKYLPEYAAGLSGQVLIRHLLNHTSGFRIPDNFVGPVQARSAEHPDAPSLRVEAARVAAIGPAVEPGRSYSYSPAGYNVLGAVLERASGKALPDLLKQEIYQPLGMRDTSHWFADKSAPAKQYAMQGAQLLPIDVAPYPFATGSGRIASTAADYFNFCQLYLNGGTWSGRRLLSAESIRRATSLTVRSQYVMPDPEQLAQRGLKPRWYYRRDGRALGLDIGYGLGWVVGADGSYSHPGVAGTFAWVDPRRDLIGIILTQSNDAKNPGIEFAAMVAAAIDGAVR
jgi:CubicO group peptidase (beta-lactamase class C family)